MTADQLIRLQKLSTELTSMNGDLLSNFDTNHFLQMVDTETSTIILGNTEGLIHLASCILEVALSNKDGQHYHFGAGSLDSCSKELEILYKKPEQE